MRNLWLALLLLAPTISYAQDFTGKWSIDLRSPDEIRKKVDCGGASFQLKQAGDRVIGRYDFATPRCGRIDEGSDKSVKGVVVSPRRAVLIVTSGRSGTIAFGVATLLSDGTMRWEITDYVTDAGDSLILQRGLLRPNK